MLMHVFDNFSYLHYVTFCSVCQKKRPMGRGQINVQTPRAVECA